MKNKRVKIGIEYVILTLLLLVTVLIGGRGVIPAFAETAGNTNVLKDLQQDETFKATDYPDNPKDHSIKVIQVAESEKDDLYLYTYQPSQKSYYALATEINMSLSETADGTRLYGLILVNTNGVFAKYLVKDIKVSSDSVRYYNVTSIYRAWDNEIDGETGTDNTGEKKAFPVRNIWRVTTEQGEKKYYCEPTFTVTVNNPYSDYLLYLTSESLPSVSSIQLNFNKLGMIDAHYVAFSTDWEIDRLKSATVTYNRSSGTGYYNTFLGFDCGGDITYEQARTDYAYPTYNDKAEYKGDLWHNGRNYDYKWDRIQTVPEFIAGESSLTDETKRNLEGKQWVLRFLETQRTQTETGILGYKKYTTNFTKVDKVSVLRLEFETDGVSYNLGAVSDMVSGDDKPGNVEEKKEGNFWFYIWDCLVKLFEGKSGVWETIVAVVAIIIVVVVVVLAIKFLRWVITELFGKGKGKE